MAETKKIFAIGQVLFLEGAPAASFFFIKKGTVSIRKKQGTVAAEVGKAQVGQVIGELSFFNDQKRTETAVALTFVEAVEVPYEDLTRFYAKVPDYLKAIMLGMAERLQIANDLIKKLKNISG